MVYVGDGGGGGNIAGQRDVLTGIGSVDPDLRE